MHQSIHRANFLPLSGEDQSSLSVVAVSTTMCERDGCSLISSVYCSSLAHSIFRLHSGHNHFNSFRIATTIFRLRRTSLQDLYQNFTVRLKQLKSPFQRWWLVCFHNNTVFLKIYNTLLHSIHTHKIWKRSVEKYKSYVTLSMTTHFLSAFCEASVVQQCTEAQAGMVQEGLTTTSVPSLELVIQNSTPVKLAA